MKTLSSFICTMVAAILLTGAATTSAARANSKVLFYMHGSDMHGKSADHKNAKNYKKIVSHLEDQGFEVIFEVRADRDAEVEAARTAQMVQDRISAGTAPEDIYVGGFSYGAMITLKTAGLIGNDKINYALFCGCPESPSISVDIDYEAVKGRVLSIVDTDDGKFGTCDGKLPGASDFVEKTITSGKGHKIFKLGKGKFINEWAPIFVGWSR